MTTMKKQFLHYSGRFSPDDIDYIIDNVVDIDNRVYNNKVWYYNIPCAFDIETSSFTLNDEKYATMYLWQLGINGMCLYGRTWQEFINVYNRIKIKLCTNNRLRLIVYVHNLAYEFQFIRKLFEWEKVFILRGRKIGYALTVDGIEFRCSYILSGYSLEYIGNNMLHKYPVQKQVGLLDYTKIRHSKTPLKDDEIKYGLYDVKVVMSYIQEKIEQDGDISKIPLTKTGYTRILCRNNCLYSNNDHTKDVKKYINYKKLISSMRLTLDEYYMLKQAAMGGYTHANANYTGKVMYNVGSIDFTSAYPYAMISDYFPMSSGVHLTKILKNDFIYFLNHKCIIFSVRFHKMHSIIGYEHYLSYSKCRNVAEYIIDNGRVVSAGTLECTITELDYKIIRQCYDWDNMEILDAYVYNRGYLPKNFILSILDLYKQKTELKGVSGKEIEYLVGKENLNSAFGMIYTDILQDSITYENDIYVTHNVDAEKEIYKYNMNKKRFLFYPWAIYVTAHCRYNLWSGILEFKDDYIYSDTDSIKCLNLGKHMKYINDYNNLVEKKLEKVCTLYDIPLSMTRPKTIKGEEKVLGVWDIENGYDKFKTLGAKRYMVENDGKLNITISGVNKKKAVPYLVNKYGNNGSFEHFRDGLIIPPDYSGKLAMTYIDDETFGIVTDYLGNTAEFHELSSAYMSNSQYELSLSDSYLKYLKGVRTINE